MDKYNQIGWTTNVQPVPSSFNGGFSYYEEIAKIIRLCNQLIDNKLDIDGDFKGTWHGLKLHYSQEGLSSDWNAARGTFPTVTQRLNNVDNRLNSHDNSIQTLLDLISEIEIVKTIDSISILEFEGIADCVIDPITRKYISGTDNTQAFKNALAAAIEQNKNLYIPAGDYYIGDVNGLEIKKKGNVRIVIYGDKKKTRIITAGKGLLVDSTENASTVYDNRVMHVDLYDLYFICDGVGEYGFKAHMFGYINLTRCEFWRYQTGIFFHDGSESIMWDLIVAGNVVGMMFKKTSVDMANMTVHNSKIYGNTSEDIIFDAAREVNIYNSDVINTVGGTKFINHCELINFISCDLENGDTLRGMEIEDAVKINFDKCLFANAFQNKIVVSCAARVTLNQCAINFAFNKAIVINDNKAEVIFRDCETGSIYVNTDKVWRNTNLMSPTKLQNYNNDFKKGVPFPVKASNTFSVDTDNFVTGTSSVKFAASTAGAKYLGFNSDGRVIEAIEVIYKADNLANCVKLVYEDNTSEYAFVQNPTYTIQNFTNGFKRQLIIIRTDRYGDKKIKSIQVDFTGVPSDCYIDSVSIYGQGHMETRMTFNGSPSMGYWSNGDIVWNDNILQNVTGWRYFNGSWVSF